MAKRLPPSGGNSSNRSGSSSSGARSPGSHGNRESAYENRKNESQQTGNPARRAGISETNPYEDKRASHRLTDSHERPERIQLHQSAGMSNLRSQNARGEQNYGEHRGQRTNKGTDASVRKNIARDRIAENAEHREEAESITPPVYEEPYYPEYPESPAYTYYPEHPQQYAEDYTFPTASYDVPEPEPESASRAPQGHQPSPSPRHAAPSAKPEPVRFIPPSEPTDKPVRDAHQKATTRRSEKRQEHKSKTDLHGKREQETRKTSKKRESQKDANARVTLDRSGKRANKAEEIRERHKRAFKKQEAGPANAVRDRYAKASIVRKNVDKAKLHKEETESAVQKNVSAAVASSQTASDGRPIHADVQGAHSSAPKASRSSASPRRQSKAAPGTKSSGARSNTASAPDKRAGGKKPSEKSTRSSTGNGRERHSARDIAGSSKKQTAEHASESLGLRRGGKSARDIRNASRRTKSTDTSDLAKSLVIGRLKRKGRSARDVVAAGALAGNAAASMADAATGKKTGESAQEETLDRLSRSVRSAPGTVKAAAQTVNRIKNSIKARKAKKQAIEKRAARNLTQKQAAQRRESAQAAAFQAAASAKQAAQAKQTAIHAAKAAKSAAVAGAGAGAVSKLLTRRHTLREALAPLRRTSRDIGRQVSTLSRVRSDSTLSMDAQRKMKRILAMRSSYGRFGKRKKLRIVPKRKALKTVRKMRRALMGRRMSTADRKKVMKLTRNERMEARKAYRTASKEIRKELKQARRIAKGGIKGALKRGLTRGAEGLLTASIPTGGASNSAEGKTLDDIGKLDQSARRELLKLVKKLWQKHRRARLPKQKLKKANKAAEKMARRAAKKAAKAAGRGAQAAGSAAGKAAAAAGKGASHATKKLARRALRPAGKSLASQAGKRLKRAGRKFAGPRKAGRNLIGKGKKAAMQAKNTVKALRGVTKGPGLPTAVKGFEFGIPGTDFRVGGFRILPKIMRGNVLNRLAIALPIIFIVFIVGTIIMVSLGDAKFIGDNTGAAAALVQNESAEMRFDMKQKLLDEEINPLYYSYQGGDHNIVHITYNTNAGFDENDDAFMIENYGDAVAIYIMKRMKETNGGKYDPDRLRQEVETYKIDRSHFDEIYEVYKDINPVTVNIQHPDIGGETYNQVLIDVRNYKLPNEYIKNHFGFSDEEMDILVKWTQPPDEQAYWFNKILGLEVTYWEGGVGVSDYSGLFVGISPDEAVYRLLQECTVYDGWSYSQERRGQAGYHDCSSFVSACYNIFATDGKFFGVKYSTSGEILRWCEQQNVAGSCNGSNYAEVMQPGDIIFWANSTSGNYKHVYHVAIYAGNGMMWESAPSSNGVIYRAVSIQRPNNIMAYGRPLALADRINWDGSLLPMGPGGAVGTGGTVSTGNHMVPSTFKQTGIIADYTPAIRDWSAGTPQRALYQQWQAAGRPTDGPIMMLNNRVLVATVFPAGYNITIELSNGNSIKAITMDEKGEDRYTQAGATKPGCDWGHKFTHGYSLVEFECNYPRGTGGKQDPVAAVLKKHGWYGASVTNIIVEGPVG